MWEFRAPKTDRLDRLLRDCGQEGSEWLSRQAWGWLLENGCVRVEGRTTVKPGVEVKEGTSIQVSLPGSTLGLTPASEKAECVWRSADQTLGLFSKPAGIPTLPLVPWDHTAFANRVAAYAGGRDFEALSDPPILEGGILQRLDTDTSGLLAVAFTTERKAMFRQLFSRSAFRKTYLALLSRGVKGTHKVFLSPQGAKVRASLKGPGEEAVLTVEVLKSSAKGALVQVTTQGGARHIVRAGLAALGSPLVGDALYGGSSEAPHHQLHASRLELLEPAAFPEFPNTLTLPPPPSFLDSCAHLGLD